jgi:hypothetical protein
MLSQAAVAAAPSVPQTALVFDNKSAAEAASADGKKSLLVRVLLLAAVALIVYLIVDMIVKYYNNQKMHRTGVNPQGAVRISGGTVVTPHEQRVMQQVVDEEAPITMRDELGQLLTQDSVPVVIDAGYADSPAGFNGFGLNRAYAFGATQYSWNFGGDQPMFPNADGAGYTPEDMEYNV